MTFVQILSLRSSDVDELARRNDEWLDATAGRRTLVRSEVYRDRHDPEHYLSLNVFPDADAAAANSALPETDAMAAGLAGLVRDLSYTDLDVVMTWSSVDEVAAAFVRFGETNGRDGADALAPDVRTTMMFPDYVGSTTGRDAVAAGLADEAPGRTFETWEPQPTRDGFLAEYAYRTTATDTQPSALSVGLVAATVSGGRITRLVLTCAGSWTRDREAQILGLERAGATS